MKIVSWNVNGLRSIYKYGLLEWLKKIDVDIVCLQEIKAREAQLPTELLRIKGYYSCFNSAVKKGYSGLVVYTKKKPLQFETSIGLTRFDQEGRILKLDYPDFSLLNVYFPHGGRKKENIDYKLQAYSYFLTYLGNMRNKEMVLIGDFNIAHKEIDLARPKENRDNIMFTPKERKQLDKLIGLGFIDTFRQFHTGGDQYTWFSYLHRARERGLGWRLDYAFISKKLKPNLKDAFIFSEVRGSDHCPIGIEIHSS